MSASLAALARNGWVNFAISQGAWFACVLGAAGGRPWLGPLVVLAWAALHVALCPDPRREAQLLLAVGVLGYVLDSGLVLGGLLVFPPPSALGGPSSLWMVALWVLFGTTLHGPLAPLVARPWLAAAAGAILGPLAYGAGVRLGAAAFGPNPGVSQGAVGLVWAAALPAMGWLARRLALRRLRPERAGRG